MIQAASPLGIVALLTQHKVCRQVNRYMFIRCHGSSSSVCSQRTSGVVDQEEAEEIKLPRQSSFNVLLLHSRQGCLMVQLRDCTE